MGPTPPAHALSMCGLAGHVGPHPPDEAAVRRTLERLRHRGPDTEGVYRAELSPRTTVTLLHTRLAIQDLTESSAQPFHTRSGVLAFNGEIYNFRELRKSLGSAGYRFQTSGDTEVLATLLEAGGIDGLNEVEGMYALAWLDTRANSFWLARDPFGEKPLYVVRHHDDMWFASEIPALKALSEIPIEPNESQIRRFLVNGYKSLNKSQDTFFTNVQSVRPGVALCIRSDGSFGEHEAAWRPWRGSEAPVNDDMTFAEAVEGARVRLFRSIELRLRADVPVALTLSGGIDSTALAAICKREFGKSLTAFTIASGDSRYDDSEIARRTAHELEIGRAHV